MHANVTVINKLHKYSEAKMKPQWLFIIVCFSQTKPCRRTASAHDFDLKRLGISMWRIAKGQSPRGWSPRGPSPRALPGQLPHGCLTSFGQMPERQASCPGSRNRALPSLWAVSRSYNLFYSTSQHRRTCTHCPRLAITPEVSNSNSRCKRA